ncbi:hypothetical protein [Peribacillus acanthi]|uniref:hypothetical protein n=1 Tax=Peribacillus acanthi TaxID=2171554 RepID=UPI000D3E85A4|nr:hypothetical protein [Peribacillus acanthi]
MLAHLQSLVTRFPAGVAQESIKGILFRGNKNGVDKMVDWIKSRFRNHRYVSIGTSSTGGTKYKCIYCKKEFYLPLEWSFSIDVKKLKGCKGRG